MDGIPLTLKQVKTFAPDSYRDAKDLFSSYNLKELLDDLVKKGYLKFEYPKKLVVEETPNGIIK